MRRDLCLGCGLCAQNCPRGAISLPRGQAEIDQSKCDSCHLCLEICPQGAIVERIPVNKKELAITVASLKQQVNDLLIRMERLKQGQERQTRKRGSGTSSTF